MFLGLDLCLPCSPHGFPETHCGSGTWRHPLLAARGAHHPAGSQARAQVLPPTAFETLPHAAEHELDLRDYGIGAQSLRDVGIGTLRLLTTNPDKVEMLEQYDLTVIEQVSPTS